MDIGGSEEGLRIGIKQRREGKRKVAIEEGKKGKKKNGRRSRRRRKGVDTEGDEEGKEGVGVDSMRTRKKGRLVKEQEQEEEAAAAGRCLGVNTLPWEAPSEERARCSSRRPSTRVQPGSPPSRPPSPPPRPFPALLQPHKGSSPQRTHLAGSGVLLSGLADGVTSVIPMLVTTWLRLRSKPRLKCEHIYTPGSPHFSVCPSVCLGVCLSVSLSFLSPSSLRVICKSPLILLSALH